MTEKKIEEEIVEIVEKGKAKAEEVAAEVEAEVKKEAPKVKAEVKKAEAEAKKLEAEAEAEYEKIKNWTWEEIADVRGVKCPTADGTVPGYHSLMWHAPDTPQDILNAVGEEYCGNDKS